MVASHDPHSILSANAITVYRISADSLIREWRQAAPEWGAKAAQWNGHDSIQFVRAWMAEARRTVPESPALLIRAGDTWRLEGVVPPEDTTEVP